MKTGLTWMAGVTLAASGLLVLILPAARAEIHPGPGSAVEVPESVSSAVIAAATVTATGNTDTIHILANSGDDDVNVWVSGRRSGGCQADLYQTRGVTDDLPIGNVLESRECVDEVAAFSESDAVVIQPVTWNDEPGEVVDVNLAQPLSVITVTVWIASSDPDLQKLFTHHAEWNMADAVRRYDEEKTGITFQFATKQVSNADQAATIQSAAQRILKTKDCKYYYDVCSNPSIFDPKRLNVYYVEHLPGVKGFACADVDPRFAVVRGIGIDYDTFAHEIGHVLSLDHVMLWDAPDPTQPEIVTQNVMCAAGCEEGNREHFTAGQAYRMHGAKGSVLNIMDWRTGPSKACGETPGDCPEILSAFPPSAAPTPES